MATMKGSATGTMKGMDSRPTELEQMTKEAADTAKKILDAYAPPQNAADQPDAEKILGPLKDDINAMAAPQDEPLPSAPSGAALGFGLLATNLAAAAARNPMLAQAGLESAKGRIEGREQVQRNNIAQRNQADAARQVALLSLREKILTETLATQKGAAADKAAKELFIVQMALGHVSDRLKAKEQAAMTDEQLTVQERIANMQAKFQFLSSVLGMDQPSASGGMDAKTEADEITKLNDFTTSIDLKLNPDTNVWQFGKKVPSDEEMTGHVRVINSYLSSPSQRVRGAALFDLKNLLQAKFGNDQAAKQKFLIENGLIAKPEGQ